MIETEEDENLQKNKDDEAFLYAFDYFFHTDCTEKVDICYQIKQHIYDNPRYARIKANIINTPNLIPPKRKIFISDVSQQFVDSLGTEVSKESIHLSILFESPLIMSLFNAYDHILKYMNDSEYPSRSEDCNCYLSGSRKIKIVVPNNEELGLILDIGNTNGQVFISQLSEDGAAYKSGCMKEGDFILRINDVDTHEKSIDELNELLIDNENGVVSFLIESYIKDEPYYIRSMVNHSVNSVSNVHYAHGEEVLNVNKGDLFEIYGDIDQDWLQACFLGNTTLITYTDPTRNAGSAGIIPLKINDPSMEEDDDDQCYERMLLMTPSPNIIRCVLLVGPGNVGRGELKKALIIKFPNKYANVVPHTTRRPRRHEVDGVNYHFVDFAQMEKYIFEGECIEHGEYNDNLYGTTYDSILRVMRQGKSPIMNVNPKTIRKLRNATFKPIIIFIKPPDILTLKQTRSKPLSTQGMALSSYFSDLDYKEMIATAGNIQRNFGQFFDVTLVNGVFQDTFRELVEILAHYDKKPTFMSQKWVDWI